MSPGELRSLPVAVDVETAGRALGIGRTKAFQLARAGTFPVPVLHLGNQYRVPTAPLLALLGVTPDMSEARPASPAIATTHEDERGPRHGHSVRSSAVTHAS